MKTQQCDVVSGVTCVVCYATNAASEGVCYCFRQINIMALQCSVCVMGITESRTLFQIFVIKTVMTL